MDVGDVTFRGIQEGADTLTAHLNTALLGCFVVAKRGGTGRAVRRSPWLLQTMKRVAIPVAVSVTVAQPRSDSFPNFRIQHTLRHLGRQDSNLEPSDSESDVLPIAPRPNVDRHWTKIQPPRQVISVYRSA